MESSGALSSDLAILVRTRERAERILGQNASNSAKALARDALELCAIIDDFRAEFRPKKSTMSQISARIVRLGG